MAGETDKPETDPKDGAKPNAEKPTDQSKDKTGDEELGEKGLRALQAERAAREKAEADLAALKAKHLTDAEKAIEAAKNEGRSEATLAANRRIVKSEVRALCADKVSDPEDAALLLGDLDRFIVKGEVDTKAISEAISALVKAKPYLAPAGKKATALAGGGATQSTGVSLNDDIRRRIRG